MNLEEYFEEEQHEEPVIEQSLQEYIEDAKDIAAQLRYPDECFKRLDICKSKIEVNNVLAYYRRRIK